MNFISCVLRSLLIFCLILQNSYASNYESPAGLWKIVDDNSAELLAFIRIYELGGKIFGRIEHSPDPADAVNVCHACKDERKDMPIIGLIIIRNLRFENGEYTDGDILDPESGFIYNCKMTLTDKGTKLLVRGYLGLSIIGKTQTWIREQ